MNEQEFARQVAQRLGESLDDLSPSVTQRLQAARAVALARATATAPQMVLAGAGSGRLAHPPARRFIPLAALLAGLALSLYWYEAARQQATHHQDVSEIDAQVLTDDLPIAAYTDKGFEAWLRHSQLAQ